MQKVAKFEKVSFDNFAAAYLMFKGPTNIEIIRKIYDDIIMIWEHPLQSGSAEFRVFSP